MATLGDTQAGRQKVCEWLNTYYIQKGNQKLNYGSYNSARV